MRSHDAVGGGGGRGGSPSLAEIMTSILLRRPLSLWSLVIGGEEASLRQVDALQEERSEKEKSMKVDGMTGLENECAGCEDINSTVTNAVLSQLSSRNSSTVVGVSVGKLQKLTAFFFFLLPSVQ